MKKTYISPDSEVLEIATETFIAQSDPLEVTGKPSDSSTPAISSGGDTEPDTEYSPW